MQIQARLSTKALIDDIKKGIRSKGLRAAATVQDSKPVSEFSVPELSKRIVLMIQKAQAGKASDRKTAAKADRAKCGCDPSVSTERAARTGLIDGNDSTLLLIQEMIESRKNGVLVIRLGNATAYTIRFRNGEIESASSSKQDENGETGALWKTLSISRGEYRFEEGDAGQKEEDSGIDPVQARFVAKNIGEVIASRKQRIGDGNEQ